MKVHNKANQMKKVYTQPNIASGNLIEAEFWCFQHGWYWLYSKPNNTRRIMAHDYREILRELLKKVAAP
jgi:hypothetical protein